MQTSTPAAAHPDTGTAAPHPIGMFDDERAHPWRAAAVYTLTLLAALLASHWWPSGFAA